MELTTPGDAGAFKSVRLFLDLWLFQECWIVVVISKQQWWTIGFVDWNWMELTQFGDCDFGDCDGRERVRLAPYPLLFHLKSAMVVAID